MLLINVILAIATVIASHAAPAQPVHGKTNGQKVERPFCDPSWQQGNGDGC
jgi:hypothetical protein